MWNAFHPVRKEVCWMILLHGLYWLPSIWQLEEEWLSSWVHLGVRSGLLSCYISTLSILKCKQWCQFLLLPFGFWTWYVERNIGKCQKFGWILTKPCCGVFPGLIMRMEHTHAGGWRKRITFICSTGNWGLWGLWVFIVHGIFGVFGIFEAIDVCWIFKVFEIFGVIEVSEVISWFLDKILTKPCCGVFPGLIMRMGRTHAGGWSKRITFTCSNGNDNNTSLESKLSASKNTLGQHVSVDWGV